MNLFSGLNWLTSMAPRRATVRDDAPDPADMGTAFGLDASMEAQNLTAPAAAPKAAARSPLSQRLVRRPRR
jgi:hypothetical protein